MNRKEIVEKLVKEGFSEATLCNFNDKQLEKFSKKVLKEAETVTKTVYNSKDPKDVAALNNALKNPSISKDDIEVKEDDVIPVAKIRKSAGKKEFNVEKISEFVDNVVENNYHSLTTKKEMVELIKSKVGVISEKETMKIPEFMGEVELAEPAVKPEVKPAPAKPDTDKPGREKPAHPGKRPLDPNKQPMPDPAPKAAGKEISGDEAKSKIIQMVHRIFTNN